MIYYFFALRLHTRFLGAVFSNRSTSTTSTSATPANIHNSNTQNGRSLKFSLAAVEAVARSSNMVTEHDNLVLVFKLALIFVSVKESVKYVHLYCTHIIIASYYK